MSLSVLQARRKSHPQEFWGIAAVATFLASAGFGYLAYRLFFANSSKKKKANAQKRSDLLYASKRELIPPKKSHTNCLTEEQVLKMIDSTMGKLTSLGNSDQTDGEFSPEWQNYISALEKIARAIRTMGENLDSFSPSTRLKAAKWLNIYNVQRLAIDPTSNNLKISQEEDIKFSLKLLDFDDANLVHSQDEYENFVSIKLEFAQK
jgi:hypothetical protein